MKNNTVRLILLLAIGLWLAAVSLSASGCKNTVTTTQPIPASISATPASTLHSPSPSIPSVRADVILEKALPNISTARSYRLNRNISAEMSTKSDRSDLVTSRVYSKAVLDVSRHLMQMSNGVSFKQPAGQPIWPVFENTIFIDGDIMYIKGFSPDQPQVWSKTALTESIWQTQNQAKLLVQLMRPQNITVLAPETLDNGEGARICNVVKIEPDLKEFWSLIVNQPGVQLPSGPPQGLTLEQITRTASLQLWLDQASILPLKAELAIKILVSPENYPTYKETLSSSVNVSLIFSEYNQAFNIELPSEAKAASELSLKTP
jgi:hypothetical protein